MHVTLIQTEIDGSLPLAERVAGVAEQIAACTGDLVLLPELWATGYFAFDDYAGTAQPLDGPLVRAMGAAAAAAGVVLHAGSMVERDAAGSDPVDAHRATRFRERDARSVLERTPGRSVCRRVASLWSKVHSRSDRQTGTGGERRRAGVG